MEINLNNVGLDERLKLGREFVSSGSGLSVIENRSTALVFDTIGNEHLQTAFKAAALNGTVISLVSLSQQDLTLLHVKGLTLHLVFMLIPMLHGIGRAHHGGILSKLAHLVDNGMVHPLIDSESRFCEVAVAHQKAESGQVIGKCINTINLAVRCQYLDYAFWH